MNNTVVFKPTFFDKLKHIRVQIFYILFGLILGLGGLLNEEIDSIYYGIFLATIFWGSIIPFGIYECRKILKNINSKIVIDGSIIKFHTTDNCFTEIEIHSISKVCLYKVRFNESFGGINLGYSLLLYENISKTPKYIFNTYQYPYFFKQLRNFYFYIKNLYPNIVFDKKTFFYMSSKKLPQIKKRKKIASNKKTKNSIDETNKFLIDEINQNFNHWTEASYVIDYLKSNKIRGSQRLLLTDYLTYSDDQVLTNKEMNSKFIDLFLNIGNEYLDNGYEYYFGSK